MDYEDDVSRELIKCVVVGDTGVGKTRLVCAKACGQKPTLEQLINVHVPTVWAIDQYRICRDVLERSLEIVDGISIALRIWDTFGDHHNDRCFAYGRSDVVLLCFSVTSARSLEHAKTVWYPEIRRERPHVPILLIACKNDLRYLCTQAEFQRLLSEKRPSPGKLIVAEDIVLPEQGRAVAKEIGAFYYETSVLTRFGVEEAFQNAVRAALCRRRQGRLWSGHFQLVKVPQVQAPFLPPKPPVPSVRVLASQYVDQMASLISSQVTLSSTCIAELGMVKETYYDCVLRVRDQVFLVHKLMLASSSEMFRNLFICDVSNCSRCPLDVFNFEELGEVGQSPDLPLSHEETDTDLLLDDDNDVDVFCLPILHRPNAAVGPCDVSSSKEKQHKRVKSVDFPNRNYISNNNNFVDKVNPKIRHATIGAFLTTNSPSSHEPPSSGRPIHAKNAAASMSYGLPNCVRSVMDDFRCRNGNVIIPLTIVTLDNELSPDAVRLVLNYMYSGEMEPKFYSKTSVSSFSDHRINFGDILKVSQEFEIHSLKDKIQTLALDGVLAKPVIADIDFLLERNANLLDLGLRHSIFSDVKFILENGVVKGPKFLLCARCDVMRAMFSNAFRENCLSQVNLPGVTVEALEIFLTYLFTDSVTCAPVQNGCLMDYMEALEFANRMCIQRLVTLLESCIVVELERLDEMQELNVEEVLHLLEPAQLCNAQQLVSWCFYYLSCNYSRVCDQCGKLFKSLLPSNQDFITKHRWPPLWYLKDYDWHEKMLREGQKAAEMAANKLLKRARTTSGCLCFSTCRSTRLQHNSI